MDEVNRTPFIPLYGKTWVSGIAEQPMISDELVSGAEGLGTRIF